MTTDQHSPPRTPQKIILDCDPGHDDAIALLLAHGNPNLDLLAVTTVAGNQTLEKVTANARAVARVGNIHSIPFAAGASRPLLGPQLIPEEIHGDSGLDGPTLPTPDVELASTHAVNLIAEIIEAHAPGEVTLVPTGALTNIALFARMYPHLVERVGGVTLMGGGHHTGNMTPAAEFNILADPEAAQIVFEEPWPVTMVGLDVTHQVLAVPERLEQLKSVGTDVSQFVAELIEFFGAAYMKERHYPGPPMHDPLAVAAVADPSMLRVVRAPVSVETQGAHARGQTIVDLRRTWNAQGGGNSPSSLGIADDAEASDSLVPIPKHYVAFDVDVERFWSVLVDALTRIGDTGFRE
ncbi:nucleoside hydrolase [Corynebacterium sp. 320]|uniref:nucleoside hydrolase n=1 Tax=Corynebacterium TaxID=1716 RepID=UPI00125CCD75|nr:MULTISPECIES: nucleoside hydrolase [Corynebacterium]KAB1502825.1 nucleoside hydrolase [Corynebacterium sp. 320]KAB1550434.1 nucleoside hydrolase [Corynebacterium sp. 319]KAB1554835.1 nucleoside hydrolase [Corynebacterium sp. 321]KAB3526488.1 nucleoside hydrolase [Corynebacterium sp. 250]KAB3539807.1 nucleoside hydrolase [Corynebacterium sp. 366]